MPKFTPFEVLSLGNCLADNAGRDACCLDPPNEEFFPLHIFKIVKIMWLQINDHIALNIVSYHSTLENLVELCTKI